MNNTNLILVTFNYNSFYYDKIKVIKMNMLTKKFVVK